MASSRLKPWSKAAPAPRGSGWNSPSISPFTISSTIAWSPVNSKSINSCNCSSTICTSTNCRSLIRTRSCKSFMTVCSLLIFSSFRSSLIFESSFSSPSMKNYPVNVSELNTFTYTTKICLCKLQFNQPTDSDNESIVIAYLIRLEYILQWKRKIRRNRILLGPILSGIENSPLFSWTYIRITQ